MKKFISLYILILFILCTISFSYGADDFFIDGSFKEIPIKTPSPKVEKTQADEIALRDFAPKKEGLIDKIKKEYFEKKVARKQKKGEEIKGYYGELPNINQDFKYKQKTPPTVKKEYKTPTLDDIDKENFKSAPFDDALFLDNIIKKEKTSDYVNRIQKVKLAFISLKNALEEETNVQKINACINMTDLYTTNIQKTYQDKTEALKESYKQILLTNYEAKVFGNLLYESNYYSRVIPVAQGQYSEENLNSEKNKLLNKVNQVIFLINEEE